MKEHFNHPVDLYFEENLISQEGKPSPKIWNSITGELDYRYNREKLVNRRNHLILAATLTGILVFFNFGLKDYSGAGGKTHVSSPAISKKQTNIPVRPVPVTKDIYPLKARLNLSFNPTFHEFSFVHTGGLKFISFHQTEIKYSTALPDAPLTESRSLVKIETKQKHRISIEPFFIKEFAGYNFADNDVSGVNGKEIEQRERTMFSSSLGFYINYPVNRHWVIQSGLVFSSSESNIDSFATYAKKTDNGTVQFKLNTVSGYSYLNSPAPGVPAVGDSVQTSGTYSYVNYISIPLIVSYRIPMKRFSALIGAGTTFNVLSSAMVETDIDDARYSKHESRIPLNGLRKTNFGLIVKAEFSYQFRNHWSINLLSSFKNTLGPINLNSAVSAYPYNIGVGLGMTYQF
jgi:Outer membrane protein beta-barrel domain